MFKGQKGITLVALVITIIVLLILAGVSISLVVGQNGVLTRATSSVAANKAASVKQAVSLGLASCETKYYADWVQNQAISRESAYTVGALSTELSNQGYTLSAPTTETATLIGTTELTVTSGTDEVKLNITIDANGKITWGTIQIKNGSTYENVNGI